MNYLELGICAIAVNEKKQAIYPWKPYQERLITQEEFDKQMSDPRAKGVAIICGSVSGGLEAIDIDLKYQTYDLYEKICESVPKEIYDKMHIVRTKSNGVHWLYRCEEIEGNQKLAQRNATNEELARSPSIKSYCIIETRGESGYVVAPPSQGYAIEQEGFNVISVEERATLFEIMRSFNELVEEVHIEAHNRPSSKEYALSPFDDFNRRGDIVELMLRNGWTLVKENSERIFFKRPGSDSAYSGSWNKQMSLFSVFSVNTPFIVQKGYKLSAVYAILEHNGDFKKAARELVSKGFGERKVVDEMSEDSILKFWDVNNRGRVEINRYKLQIFLSVEKGFKLFFYDKNDTNYKLIRLCDGFVYDASSEQVKKEIKAYVDSLPDTFDGSITPSALLEQVYKYASALFSENFFEFFDRADIDFLRDTKDSAFFPFNNGVIEVSKGGVKLRNYGEFGQYVYKSQTIDHFIVVDQDEIKLEDIEFYRFLKFISGEDLERTLYTLSLVGYLLHGYKDPARPFAVILAEETDNEEKGGGTGKGIFVKALSYINKVVRVDGKNFKLDKNFAFQRVDLDTKIVAIEDVRKNVDFEGFYSIITEGITVEKKNQNEVFIPYKDSPKIMFTTNYTITQNGVHAKRRQRVLEFSPYFNAERTPEDEFGHKLFDDWDKDEWNRFYNLLFFCVREYLEFGIPKREMSDSMLRKSIRNQFGEEFLEYFMTICDNDQWVSFDMLHQDFLTQYGMDKKDYSRKRFSKGIEIASTILFKEFEKKRNIIEHNKFAIRFHNRDKDRDINRDNRDNRDKYYENSSSENDNFF